MFFTLLNSFRFLILENDKRIILRDLKKIGIIGKSYVWFIYLSLLLLTTPVPILFSMRLVFISIILFSFVLITSGWRGPLQYPEYIKYIKEMKNYKNFRPTQETPGYFKRSLFSSMVHLWRVLTASGILRSGNQGSGVGSGKI